MIPLPVVFIKTVIYIITVLPDTLLSKQPFAVRGKNACPKSRPFFWSRRLPNLIFGCTTHLLQYHDYIPYIVTGRLSSSFDSVCCECAYRKEPIFS